MLFKMTKMPPLPGGSSKFTYCIFGLFVYELYPTPNEATFTFISGKCLIIRKLFLESDSLKDFQRLSFPDAHIC